VPCELARLQTSPATSQSGCSAGSRSASSKLLIDGLDATAASYADNAWRRDTAEPVAELTAGEIHRC
jgi:hypothetical protein